MNTALTHAEWTILVVEDEFDSQQLVSRVLKHFQVQVHIVNNGLECVNALLSLAPTLVIMDLAMPKMDGWETLAAIRTNALTAHLPVVAITAFHSDEVERGAVAAGFDAYIRKPIQAATLIRELERVLHSDKPN